MCGVALKNNHFKANAATKGSRRYKNNNRQNHNNYNKKRVHKKILCTRNNVEKHKFAFIVASQDLGFDPLFACLTSRPTASAAASTQLTLSACWLHHRSCSRCWEF